MNITPEELGAYRWGLIRSDMTGSLVIALRHHVAAEMRLEFEREHVTGFGFCAKCRTSWDDKKDSLHNRTDADWGRAAHEALLGGKSDE